MARALVRPELVQRGESALPAWENPPGEGFGPCGVRVRRSGEPPAGFGSWVAAETGVDHAAFLRHTPETFGTTTGRIAEPPAVAALIVFLLSEVAGTIAGAA